MGIARGVVFAGVAFLPSLVLGLILYILLGGNTGSSVGGADFMYGPCYGVPFICILSAFVMGISADVRE
ncbi:hypothetical protein N8653_05105 [Euryarchaeota archaeon]|nr:hypothetical protein [Euryarchaeota archaeon]|tara:strand:- start:14362 stop:14568 length:207 start_codon:yes stop_codon:yes gene_type:complete